MMSSNDVRDVKFDKAMNGYKREEVDNFLDAVEQDYRQYEAYIQSMQERVNSLNAEIEQYKNSQSSLQNVLLSAQQLADKITAEAKEKAKKIIDDASAAAQKATAEAKDMLSNFDEKLAEKKLRAEGEMAVCTEKARKEQEAVKAVTAEAVRQQQALFDKLRLEVGAFKNDLLEQYKKHIEFISKMPDCVAMDAQRAAKAVELELDKQYKLEDAVKNYNSASAENTENKSEEEAAPAAEEKANETVKNDTATGFTVNTDTVKDTQTSDSADASNERKGFANSFFSKNK